LVHYGSSAFHADALDVLPGLALSTSHFFANSLNTRSRTPGLDYRSCGFRRQRNSPFRLPAVTFGCLPFRALVVFVTRFTACAVRCTSTWFKTPGLRLPVARLPLSRFRLRTPRRSIVFSWTGRHFSPLGYARRFNLLRFCRSAFVVRAEPHHRHRTFFCRVLSPHCIPPMRSLPYFLHATRTRSLPPLHLAFSPAAPVAPVSHGASRAHSVGVDFSEYRVYHADTAYRRAFTRLPYTIITDRGLPPLPRSCSAYSHQLLLFLRSGRV